MGAQQDQTIWGFQQATWKLDQIGPKIGFNLPEDEDVSVLFALCVLDHSYP
jgi:hypothetical protein